MKVVTDRIGVFRVLPFLKRVELPVRVPVCWAARKPVTEECCSIGNPSGLWFHDDHIGVPCHYSRFYYDGKFSYRCWRSRSQRSRSHWHPVRPSHWFAKQAIWTRYALLSTYKDGPIDRFVCVTFDNTRRWECILIPLSAPYGLRLELLHGYVATASIPAWWPTVCVRRNGHNVLSAPLLPRGLEPGWYAVECGTHDTGCGTYPVYVPVCVLDDALFYGTPVIGTVDMNGLHALEGYHLIRFVHPRPTYDPSMIPYTSGEVVRFHAEV